jgi:hypothetical protein
MFALPYVFGGFLVGLLLVSIFNPMEMKVKLMPDVHNPDSVVFHDGIKNGCFHIRPYEVPCPMETDSLNLLAISK